MAKAKYKEGVSVIITNDNYELVHVSWSNCPYQINNTEDLTSPNWFCYDGFYTLEEALKEFNKYYS